MKRIKNLQNLTCWNLPYKHFVAKLGVIDLYKINLFGIGGFLIKWMRTKFLHWILDWKLNIEITRARN